MANVRYKIKMTNNFKDRTIIYFLTHCLSSLLVITFPRRSKDSSSLTLPPLLLLLTSSDDNRSMYFPDLMIPAVFLVCSYSCSLYFVLMDLFCKVRENNFASPNF